MRHVMSAPCHPRLPPLTLRCLGKALCAQKCEALGLHVEDATSWLMPQRAFVIEQLSRDRIVILTVSAAVQTFSERTV